MDKHTPTDKAELARLRHDRDMLLETIKQMKFVTDHQHTNKEFCPVCMAEKAIAKVERKS